MIHDENSLNATATPGAKFFNMEEDFDDAKDITSNMLLRLTRALILVRVSSHIRCSILWETTLLQIVFMNIYFLKKASLHIGEQFHVSTYNSRHLTVTEETQNNLSLTMILKKL